MEIVPPKRRARRCQHDWLEILETNKSLSGQALAAKLNIPYPSVMIKRRQLGYSKPKGPLYWLPLLEATKELDTAECATKLGYPSAVILRKRHLYGFPFVRKKRIFLLRKIEVSNFEEHLRKNNHKTYEEIGKELGVSRQAIEQHYKRLGITRQWKIKWREDVLSLAKNLGPIITPSVANSIARQVGKDNNTVVTYLRKLNYIVRSESLLLRDRGMRRCCNCKEVKPLEMMSKISEARGGRSHRCKVCTAISVRNYYARKRAELVASKQ